MRPKKKRTANCIDNSLVTGSKFHLEQILFFIKTKFPQNKIEIFSQEVSFFK